MTARTGKDPGQLYAELTAKYGNPIYERIDAAAKAKSKKQAGQNSRRSKLPAEKHLPAGTASHAIGSPEAPGNHGVPIGGLKVTTENAGFAARPSGTEDVYKIYAESFLGKDHLKQIQTEAQALVNKAIT